MSQRSTDQGGGIEMLKAPEWPLPAETLVKKLRNAPFRESHFLNTYFLNGRGGVGGDGLRVVVIECLCGGMSSQ